MGNLLPQRIIIDAEAAEGYKHSNLPFVESNGDLDPMTRNLLECVPKGTTIRRKVKRISDNNCTENPAIIIQCLKEGIMRLPNDNWINLSNPLLNNRNLIIQVNGEGTIIRFTFSLAYDTDRFYERLEQKAKGESIYDIFTISGILDPSTSTSVFAAELQKERTNINVNSFGKMTFAEKPASRDRRLLLLL